MAVPEPSITDLVRARCRVVAESNELVVIDHDRLVAYAGSLAPGPPRSATGVPDADPWAVAGDDDEAVAALVVALDAVNFGSGYHPLVRKLPGCSGATTMATHLRRWAAGTGGIRAGRLAALTPGEVFAIFDQPVGDPATDPVAELVAAFHRALVELGSVVAERHGSSFLALVTSAGGSADALVATFAALPTWADTATWRGVDVPILKRAQLVVADLHRAFGGRGAGAFDVARLTAFADNLVPHVLAVDGVLRLHPDLATAIGAGQLLEPGAEPEVALRAGGLHAVELLAAELRARGTPVLPADLDQALWRRGGGARYKAVPRPRCRGTAY